MNTTTSNFTKLALKATKKTIRAQEKERMKKDIKSATDILGVGRFISFISFTSSMHEGVFRDKVYKFFTNIEEIDTSKVIEEIENNSKYQERLGRVLLDLIDKMDYEVKPEVLANLWSAFLKEEISYVQFLKLSHILKTVFYFDLIQLKDSYDGAYLQKPVDSSLYSLGLINQNANFAAKLEAGLKFDSKGSKPIENYEYEKDSLRPIAEILVRIGLKDVEFDIMGD